MDAMFKQLALVFFGLALLLPAHAGDTDGMYAKLFQPGEAPDLEIAIAISEDGDSVVFLAKNTTKSDIDILPFGVISNYLVFMDYTGAIFVSTRFRHGRDQLMRIPAGTIKEIKHMPFRELLDYVLRGNTSARGDLQVLWVIDGVAGEKQATRYVSNLLHLSRDNKAQ